MELGSFNTNNFANYGNKLLEKASTYIQGSDAPNKTPETPTKVTLQGSAFTSEKIANVRGLPPEYRGTFQNLLSQIPGDTNKPCTLSFIKNGNESHAILREKSFAEGGFTKFTCFQLEGSQWKPINPANFQFQPKDIPLLKEKTIQSEVLQNLISDTYHPSTSSPTKIMHADSRIWSEMDSAKNEPAKPIPIHVYEAKMPPQLLLKGLPTPYEYFTNIKNSPEIGTPSKEMQSFKAYAQMPFVEAAATRFKDAQSVEFKKGNNGDFYAAVNKGVGNIQYHFNAGNNTWNEVTPEQVFRANPQHLFTANSNGDPSEQRIKSTLSMCPPPLEPESIKYQKFLPWGLN